MLKGLTALGSRVPECPLRALRVLKGIVEADIDINIEQITLLLNAFELNDLKVLANIMTLLLCTSIYFTVEKNV